MSLFDGAKQPRLIVIAGPTGIGKTEAALHLAGEFNGEIISADSMQVYRYLDIGTAKPTAAERQQIPHHLIDCADPDEDFNAARFLTAAEQAIAAISGRGKNIFLVGGTGLYIRVLLGGLLPGPGPNGELRSYYQGLLADKGKEYLHNLLKSRDPAAADGIDSRDAVRVVRALEYIETTGASIVEGRARHRFQAKHYEALKIGLLLPREDLFVRIEKRADAMFRAGLAEETQAVLDRGYSENLKPLQSLGYKHICNYLHGRCTLAEAQGLMVRDTRHYAKRQMTWFRKEDEMIWVSPEGIKKMKDQIVGFLSDG